MTRDIINFDEIDEHGPQEYHGTFTIAVSELDREEVSNLAPVDAEVHVEVGNSTGEYVADGSVKFTADFECSRCLDPYPFAATSTFHVRFRPRPEITEENEEVEITQPEELDVEFYSERTVPLRDLAIEQVQLSIPMKPLCTENCLGLCAECGKNRNKEQCTCAPETDERWGALADIRNQLAKKINN
ncbi:MAG TPA: DUF177 domain-containing protein [Thermoanaerobaculia bacterium]|jgi:uncharacterized protein